ncbi:hypothetical protein B0H19DRAFT_231188 [Mycena capillaripes]|nr:hypothetical protein B0H19DRAFT_231188 [Mycena capillaripes]
MRPLPSPPTSAPLQVIKSNDSSASFMWPTDSSAYSTPSTAQSFVVRLPIGVEFPKIGSGAPRLLKARRREGRIFTHSPSSSMSSFESFSSCSIVTAEFWMPPQDVTTISVTAASNEDDTKITPTTPTTPTPKTKPKSKPANIFIPHNPPTTTVVSPTSPIKSPLPTPLPTPIPSQNRLETVPGTPLCPLSPNRRIQSPNARIRKLAKLTRTLGENVPIELVFPSGATSSAPSDGTPASALRPTKRAKMRSGDSPVPRVSPSGPLPTTCPRSRPSAPKEWPLTPTPDCTFDVDAHSKTAVGLHYALVMNSFPNRAVATVRAPLKSRPHPHRSRMSSPWTTSRGSARGRLRWGRAPRRSRSGFSAGCARCWRRTAGECGGRRRIRGAASGTSRTWRSSRSS